MTTNNTALIDNDFFEHFIEILLPQEDKAELMKRVFQGLDVNAAMHPLVYRFELVEAQTRLYYFQNGIIRRLSFIDCFEKDSAKENYYCWLIPELYKKLTGKELGASGKDVLTFWIRQASLGEVHSMAACLVCGFGLFLSDDRGSKMLKGIIEREYSETIRVYSRNDVVDNLPVGTLRSKEKKRITHVIKSVEKE